jgi:hypothetical protein
MSTVSSQLYVHQLTIAILLTCLQLGGIGDDDTYSLGDDALLCLKDLRKWLKFGDGELNRRDVARCMAEANLVKGDLLEILAKISPRVTEDKWRHKLAVATCAYDRTMIITLLTSASGTPRAFDMAFRNRPNRGNRKSPPTWTIYTACTDRLQASHPPIRPRSNPADGCQDRITLHGCTTARTNTERRRHNPYCTLFHP